MKKDREIVAMLLIQHVRMGGVARACDTLPAPLRAAIASRGRSKISTATIQPDP